MIGRVYDLKIVRENVWFIVWIRCMIFRILHLILSVCINIKLFGMYFICCVNLSGRVYLILKNENFFTDAVCLISSPCPRWRYEAMSCPVRGLHLAAGGGEVCAPVPGLDTQPPVHREPELTEGQLVAAQGRVQVKLHDGDEAGGQQDHLLFHGNVPDGAGGLHHCPGGNVHLPHLQPALTHPIVTRQPYNPCT